MDANLIKKVTGPAELVYLEFRVVSICRSDVESLPVVMGIVREVIMELCLDLVIPIGMTNLLGISLCVVVGIPVKAASGP